MSHRLFARAAVAASLGLIAGCATNSSSTDEFALLTDGAKYNGDVRIKLLDSQTYVPINDTGPGRSNWEGTGVSYYFHNPSNPHGPSEDRFIVLGIRDNATDVLILTDTQVLLYAIEGNQVSAPGFKYTDPGPVVEGTSWTRLEYAPGDFGDAAAYDYSRFFEIFSRKFEETSPGVYASDLSLLGYGVLGVSTHPDDMPTIGTATYSGHARTRRFDFSDIAGTNYYGTATVEANFADGTVDVSTTAVASIGGATELRMDGAQIDGNAFDGGTITILDGDTDVTATYMGTVTSLDGAGMFYGPVEGGASDEVGGWMLTIGTGSSLLTHFLAD